MPGTRCKQCGRSLGGRRSVRAQFCSDRCRAGAVRLRSRLESLPASIRQLYDLLCEYAPAGAIGYRLIWADGRTAWQYPPAPGRRWTDADGVSCRRGHFTLWPFEVPVVPRRDLYGIQFVSMRHTYRTPPELLAGVAVDPVRPMRIEEGGEL